MSKYGDFSGPYFSAFALNTGEYGPEKTPYLDTFYVVDFYKFLSKSLYSSTGICCTPVEDHFKVIDVLLLSVNNEVTSKHTTQSLQSEYVDPGI